MDSLHVHSRDSKRLHRAQVRDERLEKIAGSRKKKDQPLLGRVAFFQHAIHMNGSQPLELDAINSKIQEFVHQYDEEYEELKKTRRPGRGPSAKEDLLKVTISTLEKEYQSGFFLPDLTKEDNVALLDRWEKSWSFLSNMSWVRVSPSGSVQPSSFPPKH